MLSPGAENSNSQSSKSESKLVLAYKDGLHQTRRKCTNGRILLAFLLGQESLTRLEDFLMAVLNEMQPDCHLWFAFQPNTLKDFNPNTPKEWPQMVRDMKTRLEKLFYVPTLSNNLRNSSEVFSMTEVITANEIFSNIQDSLGVTTVAMTIHATIPKLIPIFEKENVSKAQNFHSAHRMLSVKSKREHII